MAPKAMKRPAAAGASAPKGKRGRLSSAESGFKSKTKAKVMVVSEAIEEYDGLNDSTKKMLCSLANSCLATLKADRHEYQARMVEMLGETVETMKKTCESKIEDIQLKVDNAASEKVKTEETEKTIAAEVEKLKGLLDAAKETMDADEKPSVAAHAAVALAKGEQRDADADFDRLLAKKASLESAFNDIFKPLQSSKSKGHEGNRNLKKLDQVCTEFQFDAAMLSSIPETLKKEPEERGTYDKMVVQQMEETFGSKLASMTAELEKLTPAKAERAAAVEAKEAEMNQLSQKHIASIEAYEKARDALQETTKALTEAQGAVASFEDKAKADVEALAEAKTELEDFMSGPMQAFLDCKDLEPPPPEPEPVAEPEVAEEPAPPVDPEAPAEPAPADPAPAAEPEASEEVAATAEPSAPAEAAEPAEPAAMEE